MNDLQPRIIADARRHQLARVILPKRAIDLTGKRFGHLIALTPSRVNGETGWECRCDCGSTTTVRTDCLTRGKTKSCGCQQYAMMVASRGCTGISSSDLYGLWQSMLRRCDLPSIKNYSKYGGRGIRVCERWQKFENFRDDMGPRPEGTSIDRIDNDGNYEPGNCRWATLSEQGRNKRSNFLITAFGESKTPIEWTEDPRCACIVATLRRRIEVYGWDAERAVTTPPASRRDAEEKATIDDRGDEMATHERDDRFAGA